MDWISLTFSFSKSNTSFKITVGLLAGSFSISSIACNMETSPTFIEMFSGLRIEEATCHGPAEFFIFRFATVFH
jgi:hypothetical protein